MNLSESEHAPSDSSEPDTVSVLWKPLTRLQRRVAGVLVEKSKTTPDIYPMSLNAIKTGANQKSNRSPKMDLKEHEVEDVLYELRELGAVVEVHSGGRVPKYKHLLYEWLGVDKAELAVMAELLLRGEQTIGELRARAARMEKSITGLPELKPILNALIEKRLVVELSPPGRGQMITHNLYQAEELKRIRDDAKTSLSATQEDSGTHDQPAHPRSPKPADNSQWESLVRRIEDLEQQVEQLTEKLEQLTG